MDWSDANVSGFDVVAPRVMGWTQQALNTLRNRQGRIAATQVDVVTHSMGGILARKHATGLTYQR